MYYAPNFKFVFIRLVDLLFRYLFRLNNNSNNINNNDGDDDEVYTKIYKNINCTCCLC